MVADFLKADSKYSSSKTFFPEVPDRRINYVKYKYPGWPAVRDRCTDICLKHSCYQGNHKTVKHKHQPTEQRPAVSLHHNNDDHSLAQSLTIPVAQVQKKFGW